MNNTNNTNTKLSLLAERIKLGLIGLVLDGTVPPTVERFADVHDYCDANALGDFDWTVAGMPDTDEQEAGVQSLCDTLNAAQGEVDEWIKGGGLKTI